MTSAPYAFSLLLDEVAVLRGGGPVVTGASIRLTPGAALILSGPNGSGKTSLLRAIAGFCRHEGRIGILGGRGDGEDTLPPDAASLHIHYVGHDSGLTRRRDARAHLAFWQRLLGQAPHPDIGAVIARMGLPAGPVWQYSAGQQRRLALSRLIAVPRAIWLLDEPVTALDAAARALLADLCAEHRAAGGIVIASSHGPLTLPGAGELALCGPVAA